MSFSRRHTSLGRARSLLAPLRRARPEQRDERGAVLIFTAMCMVLLLWAGALGVDVGFTVYGSRQAQAMADTAALDLARYINVADTQPTQAAVQSYLDGKLSDVLTDNGSNAGLTVTPGLWRNGVWSVPITGCAPTTPPAVYPCNAIKVSATQKVPQIFYGGFNSVTGHAGASTIAAVTPEAGFSIGSFLLNFNSQQSAVLDAILGTLGTSVDLTAVGYQGLANTYVSVNQLISASGGLLTTSNVMTASLSGSQWLAIWSDAVANQVSQLDCGHSPTPNPCNASVALSALDFSSSTSAQLCQLVSINGSSCSNGTLSTPALNASLDALQMFTTEAELANGTSALDVTSALSITGVTSAHLYLTLIQPPQVAYGPVGSYPGITPCPATSGTSTCATTAQLQADLQLNVLGVGLLDIPLSAASGTATLKTVNCSNDVMTSTKIGVSTTTATANVTLAGDSIATLTIGGYNGPQIGFASNVVPPTASTAAADTNPITVGTNNPTLSYSGLSLLSPVYALLTSTLSGVLGPVLQAAGVSVGGAEVAVPAAANCDAVSIVQ